MLPFVPRTSVRTITCAAVCFACAALFTVGWRYSGLLPDLRDAKDGLRSSLHLFDQQMRCRSTFNGMAADQLAEVEERVIHDGPICADGEAMERRYGEVRRAPGSVLLAANLYNSEGILSAFLQELPALARFLRPRQLKVVIYANGSTDKTPVMLHQLALILREHGIEFVIHAGGERADDIGQHRIERLAGLRNMLLQPLQDSTMCEGRPAQVVFINDVVWCASDVLEVLLQRDKQNADLICGFDYFDYGGLRAYDTWVLHDMSGKTLYPEERMRHGDYDRMWDTFDTRPDDRDRYEKNLPIQVFSCWNGLLAVSAQAFYPPNSISFRTSQIEGPNSHSECYLFSVDLWKQGFGRIGVTTRARVGYGLGDYQRAHEELDQKLTTSLGDAKCTHQAGVCDPRFEPWSENERIEWDEEPPAKIQVFPGDLQNMPEWLAWDAP